MDLRDLIAALRKHTDIKGLEIDIEIKDNMTVSYAQIGFPESYVPQMAHFIQAYKIPKVEWKTIGLTEMGPWKRIRFLITY